MINFKDKNVLVLGLGVSGVAACKLLIEKGARVKVSEGSDTPEVRERLGEIEENLAGQEVGANTSEFCFSSEMVVASPGVDVTFLREKGVLNPDSIVIGELELGALFCAAPIIAITGTNGKSTVTELVGHILDLSDRHTVVCGNIGNPLCGEVGKLTKDSIAVVEVSSFQLETIDEFKPYIAVLLNITDDHYDRHGDYETYKCQKLKIFKNQGESDWAVIHKSLKGEVDPLPRVLFYGNNVGDMPVDEIPIKGTHNLDNIECVMKVCDILGIDSEIILKGIKCFKPLAHRFEKVAEVNGVEFIDDSKATNIDATRRALESVNKKVVLIAGGKDKLGDYQSIRAVIKDKVKVLVLIGEAADRIKEAFGEDVDTCVLKNMEDAVKKSFELADEGEAVLLSPMCSSFDMYKSYKERGDKFKQAVKNLRVDQ